MLKKTLKRINLLMQDIERNGYSGIGGSHYRDK
jgi:Txe/YoeB family toxin of Txe-Axe toxin-antitoxin module